MTVTKDTVVSVGYVLKNEQGGVLDQTTNKPLVYLHGHKNILPGVEKALGGLAVGERVQTVVPPAEGYGQPDPRLRFQVDRNRLGMEEPKQNSMVQLQAPNGETMVARIAAVDEKQVVLDANHPLAGQDLHFDLQVLDVRPAQPAEVAQGKVLA